MSGHQRWFVNKFQQYNLDLDAKEKMQPIIKAEEKEEERTRAGWSKENYTGIWTKVTKLDLQESVDRRVVFELTGRKLNPDGNFVD
jgi:hypothetical protein